MDAEPSGIPSTSAGHVTTRSANSEVSIIQNTKLSILPESIIHRVFAYLTHSELLQVQRVNKHFRKVIRRNAHLLCRAEITEMRISMCSHENRMQPFGRLQPLSIFKPSRRRRLIVKITRKANSTVKCREFIHDEEDYAGDRNDLSVNFLNHLEDRFKQVDVHGVLSFSGIAITTSLYSSLCKNWVRINNATRLVFTLCRLRLPAEYFCELLRRTSCQKLNIELSHFGQSFLDDLVLEAMPTCQELILSSVVPMFFSGLTDRTLHRWAVQERLPAKILLLNIQTNFTFDGIITLINALQIRHPEIFSNSVRVQTAPNECTERMVYEWEFGCIPLPEQTQNSNIVELLSTPGVVTHITRSCVLANVIDVTMNSKDFYLCSKNYQLSVKLQLVIVSQKTT